MCNSEQSETNAAVCCSSSRSSQSFSNGVSPNSPARTHKVRERERERERDGQTDSLTETETQAETQTQT